MKISTSVKVGAGLAVMLLLLLAVADRALRSVRETARSARLVEHTLDVESDVDDLENALLAAESATRGFLLTGEDRYLDPFRSAPAIVREQLRELRRKTSDNPVQQRHLDALEPLIAAKLARMEWIVGLRRREGAEAVLAEVRSGVGRALMGQIRGHLRMMYRQEERLVVDRSAAETAHAASTVRFLLLTASVAALFVLAAGGLIHRDLLGRRRAEEALRNLSMVDEMTGLYNRRGFLVHAEDRVKFSARLRATEVLVFADLDGLKAINDTHGHAAGDAAIAAAATFLKASFRETDVVARLGGDEFVVLALMDRAEDAEVPLCALRERLDAWNARAESTFRLSLSLGVAPFEPGTPLEVLLAAADRQMYRDKQGRRAARESDTDGIPTVA